MQAAPELAEKELVPVHMPMVRDKAKLREAHEKGARQLMALADTGENVVFLTLGDPTVYCTFSYLQHILEAEGYPVALVSGVTSFPWRSGTSPSTSSPPPTRPGTGWIWRAPTC